MKKSARNILIGSGIAVAGLTAAGTASYSAIKNCAGERGEIPVHRFFLEYSHFIQNELRFSLGKDIILLL